MDDAYSGYLVKPRRYGRKKNVFLFVFIPIFLALAFFVSNLAFGFFDFKRATNRAVEIESVKFYITKTMGFRNKTDAIRLAYDKKAGGESGYLITDGASWFVVCGISPQMFDGAVAYKTKPIHLRVADNGDYGVTGELLSKFNSIFMSICAYATDFQSSGTTQREIVIWAKNAFDDLENLCGEFEKAVAGRFNDDYNCILSYAARMLFALNMLWMNEGASGYASVLKNSASWVIFALYDLTYCLK
jgi:hypothetical protein